MSTSAGTPVHALNQATAVSVDRVSSKVGSPVSDAGRTSSFSVHPAMQPGEVGR
jgi:hypothetical protein